MKFIFNGQPYKSGIYKIINIQNGRIYIGSAKEFKKRAKSHLYLLRKNKHTNRFLQYDFNKCGEDAFEFHVLEVIEEKEEKRFKIEDKYLKEFYDDQKKCYNFKKKTTGEKKVWSSNPEETRKKMSETSKQMWQDLKYREHMSEIMSETTKKSWQNPEHRENRLEGIRKVMETEEWKRKRTPIMNEVWAKDDGTRREQVSKQSKELWANPEYRERKLSQLTGRKNTPEQRKRMSEAAYNRPPDSEETKKIKSLAAKKRFQDPKQRELLAEISRARGLIPEEARKKISEANKGRPCSEETRRKISESNKGKKMPQSAIEKSREANSKTYNIILLSPEGEQIKLEKNLNAFCRQYNLSISGMWKLINGWQKVHKGWIIFWRE